jgi:hypothetical protein
MYSVHIFPSYFLHMHFNNLPVLTSKRRFHFLYFQEHRQSHCAKRYVTRSSVWVSNLVCYFKESHYVHIPQGVQSEERQECSFNDAANCYDYMALVAEVWSTGGMIVTWQNISKYKTTIPSRSHIVHHKSHMDWPKIESGPSNASTKQINIL